MLDSHGRAGQALMSRWRSLAPEPPPRPTRSWDEHYRDERDAAYPLPRARSGRDGCRAPADLFEKLAVVEDRHVARWEELFRAERAAAAARTRRRGARGCSRGSRSASAPALVLPMMLAEEGREVQAYLGLARHSQPTARRTRPRWTSRPTPRSTRASCPRPWAAKASRGTSAVPAAISAASCTGSTTG